MHFLKTIKYTDKDYRLKNKEKKIERREESVREVILVNPEAKQNLEKDSQSTRIWENHDRDENLEVSGKNSKANFSW